MISKEMIREVVTLRNNEDCNIINVADEVNVDVLKANFDNFEENKSLNKEFYITIKDLEIGAVGGGFAYSQDFKDVAGKILKVNSVGERIRTVEDAQRGGRAGKITFVKCSVVDSDNVKRLAGAIDEDFIEKVYCIEFKRPDFSQRIDVVNKRLVETSISNEREIREVKDRWQRCHNAIRDFKNAINEELRKAKRLTADLEALEKRTEKDYTSDLMALASHKFFEDLRIEGENLIFTTTYIDIIDPNDTDVVFEGNKYELHVDLRNNNFRFYGLDKDRCHESCWSSHDPHPHVNGRSGEACLGNISATLVELSSSREIFALFISLTNFLQTFNIDDYAGKKIKNWNTKEGIEHPYKTGRVCSECGRDIDEDDFARECNDCNAILCDDCGTWHEHDDELYCEDCYSNHTETCSECDSIIEDLEDGVYRCEECGAVLCESCAVEHNDSYYCEGHVPEEEEEIDEEENMQEQEDMQEEREEEELSNTFRCSRCLRSVELSAKQEWIDSEGAILDMCPACVEELVEA